jgi:hypothetical protein
VRNTEAKRRRAVIKRYIERFTCRYFFLNIFKKKYTMGG